MRTKSRAGKSRPCNSIPPSNPSLISLPLLHQDEANEEYHVDGTDCGSSEGAGSIQDNDNNDDDDDADDVVVPDSVEEVDRCAGENHGAGPSRECVVVDWLEQESCIRCNSRTGQVLVCSENGCPVTIHEACMNCNPKFDNMGKFYCPYCWYKRELVRTKELRRKAMLARKELSNFLCLKRDGGNEEMQVDETESMKAASVSTMAGKINTGDYENGLNDKNKERIHHDQEETPGVESISKSDEERNSRACGSENFDDGERIQDEDIENASDSEDDEIDEDQWQMQPISSSHLEMAKGALHVSTKETSDNVGVLEENKEEPVLPSAVGTTMPLITSDATSKVPAIESFEFVLPDLDTETLVVRQKRVKRTAQKAWPQKVDSPRMPSSEPSTSAKDKEMNQQGKATAAKNSVQCQELNKRFVSSKFGTEKRRRLHWTAEEEDMLKEGVRRFSSIVNKNIPWRKILEVGHHVFHSTRTPVDLKDKWKNIMAKEDPK